MATVSTARTHSFLPSAIRTPAVALAALFLSAGASRADPITVIDTFSGLYGQPWALTASQHVAFGFISPADVQVESIAVMLGTFEYGDPWSIGPASRIQLILYDDAGGKPGAALESFTVSVVDDLEKGVLRSTPTHTLNSVAKPRLVQGATYWLAAGAVGNGAAEWGDTFPQPGWPAVVFGNPDRGWTDGPNYSPGAFRIIGTAAPSTAPVPEHSTFLMLALGMSSVLTRVWRQNSRQPNSASRDPRR